MTYNSKTISVDNLVLEGVLKVLDRNNSSWTGTMTELNSSLVKVLGKRQGSELPGSPSALRIVLNRVVNRLRSRRVSVKCVRLNDHVRTRYVKFTR